jgi:ABC-type multidrug transport system, ATPase component
MLILDEPTSGVDSVLRSSAVELLCERSINIELPFALTTNYLE